MSIKSWFRLRLVLPLLTLVIIVAVVLALTVFRSQSSQSITLDRANKHLNIQYCNDSDPARRLDLYTPLNINKNMPLLVFIHGGGWTSGNRGSKLVNLYGSEALDLGIAVADVGYRLHSSSPYPDENIDIACALTWLSDHAGSYGIDSEKTIYFGDSAGGQLAAFAALNIPFNNYDYEAPVGVIDLYGVSDFTQIINGKHPDKKARFYLGSSYNTKAVNASPLSYVTKNAPRFLIIHGSNDTVVPISQSRALYDKLSQFGIDAEFVQVNGAGHGFDVAKLNTTERDQVQSNFKSFLNEVTGRSN